jgi:hypothetical protein
VGAQNQGHGKWGEEALAVVEVQLRLGLVAEVEIAHIVDYADDGGERSLAFRRLGNPPADGILAGNIYDQGFADYDDFGGSVGRSGIVESASLPQTDTMVRKYPTDERNFTSWRSPLADGPPPWWSWRYVTAAGA